jgi:hypothetical protein
MELTELKNKVKEFDQKAGFDKTEFSKLIEMIEEEVKILKQNPSNTDIVNHQITDLLILIMQISYRYDTCFEKEISKWVEKSQKYLN